MKEIKLVNSTKVALVDDDDYEKLAVLRWGLRNGYAYQSKGRNITMHRVINQTPEGMHTDHINHDKLDNRKSNLRTCTKADNQHNRRRPQNNTSGYIGVYWNKQRGKWAAIVWLKGKGVFLGYHSTAEDAAMARDNFVKKVHGQFAMLNLKANSIQEGE